MKIPVCAIFDIGKTNKKLFFFNENYEIVFEKSMQFTETQDEDGDPCEDVDLLKSWVTSSFKEVAELEQYEIKALNFSTYGASFVHLNSEGEVIAPLYNYLKPYSETLQKQFYDTYGGELRFAQQTASPVLGNLNSGMVLYRLKYEKPALYAQIHHSLHLPQFLHFLFTGKYFSDITSIGCHTNLWDFEKNQYHEWLEKEEILEKLAPIDSKTQTITSNHALQVGTGLHDSSSALIPYLETFKEPFVLISTGTWCISLNPFNHIPLTTEELQYDCLAYMQYTGKPVKASRLFAGNEHEQQTKRLAPHFEKPNDYFKTVKYQVELIEKLQHENLNTGESLRGARRPPMQESLFGQRDLSVFETYEEAYHQLILDIVSQQLLSTELVLHNAPVNKLFVDGGFGKNEIFMNLLAKAFPEMEVYAASVAQATSLGAALSIHQDWNTKALPQNLIELKHFVV
ncbi:sugar (pentulose or hexulose) kinase [Arcicella aurantiaca]|uniref:Sugar (Pentulose or hexulose) kinase n=1 Tax=Arcicella aurantiaca TaxID=591202 RepID=A0A316ECM1_9BACT|nr:FGGY family carbohydrate kinase [Arcicella aurantiaca]PWK27880.1 sugar (pentulose or hexulose) kinase [Arcicella aurantiaca]